MTDTTLDLKFGPGSCTGFTRASMAGFSDLRPAAIIRELIQNSLDAANIAGERKAIVHFRLTRGKIKDIPGIQSYRKTLATAIETQKYMCGGRLPDQVENIVCTMNDALSKQEHDILSVRDNGIGLDESRMGALLSDGVSTHPVHAVAAGIYGNGHSVVIPASDLRYILYGGVTKNGNRSIRIGAGHAVLASHTVQQKGGGYLSCGDGFLIRDFLSGRGGKIHEYGRGRSIPPLIATELSNIQKVSEHGTSVIIPAFNNFREEVSLWKLVAPAAASNFFQAIADDRLIIKVEDQRCKKEIQLNELNRATLFKILDQHRDELRASSFISGRKAFEAYKTYQEEERSIVETDIGKMEIVVRFDFVEKTGIDLCRNGMWITNSLPLFYGKFADRKPFHALLLLDSSVDDRLYRLMRSAESPLHDKLNLKYLQLEDKKDLSNALKQIVEWLCNKVPEIDSEPYAPDDFLLDFGVGDADAGGTSRKSIWGTPTAVSSWAANPHLSKVEGVGPPTVPSGGGGGAHPPASMSSKIRPKLQPIFRAASTLEKTNRRLIHLEFQKDCKNAQLRLYVDGNVDATCDGPSFEDTVPLTLGECVKVDDRQVQPAELVWENDRAVGIPLGDIVAGESLPIVVEVEYELPEYLTIFKKQDPALRIEVFRAPERLNREFK